MAKEIQVKNPLFQVGKIQAQQKNFENNSTQDNKKDSQQYSVKSNEQNNVQGSEEYNNKDNIMNSKHDTTQYTTKYTIEAPVNTESYGERLVANVTKKQKKYIKDMAKKFENESAFIRFMLNYFMENIEIK